MDNVVLTTHIAGSMGRKSCGCRIYLEELQRASAGNHALRRHLQMLETMGLIFSVRVPSGVFRCCGPDAHAGSGGRGYSWRDTSVQGAGFTSPAFFGAGLLSDCQRPSDMGNGCRSPWGLLLPISFSMSFSS
jgi:hypothetical protein